MERDDNCSANDWLLVHHQGTTNEYRLDCCVPTVHVAVPGELL